MIAETREQVHLVQQGRVLDDQRVGLGDRLPGADRGLVDPAEGGHRRPGALRAEGRERLRVAPSSKAAIESISAAVTTPWPPRPWMRTWNIQPPPYARAESAWSSASDSSIPSNATSRSGTASRSALKVKKSSPS